MPKTIHSRSLLLGTAIFLSMGGMVAAQTIEINPDELSGKSEECQALGNEILGMDGAVTVVSSSDVISALNDDNVDQCATFSEQIASSDSESLTEEVDLSQDATIDGEARVTVPEPNVDVQIPPPSVRVTTGQPELDVTQEPAEIEMEAGQPTIELEIPEIILRVTMPTPQIYVLMPEPNVAVTSAEPQVEVEQGEPTITVTQADPELSIDLGVDPDGEATGDAEATQSADGGSEMENVGGDVNSTGGEPEVEIVEADGEPTMTYQSGEPTLTYEAAEPQVTVRMAQDPTIEIQQQGEPTITFETAKEREERRAQAEEEEASAEQPNEESADEPQQMASAQQSDAAPAAGSESSDPSMMYVGDLQGMTVMTSDGEDLGRPVSFIEIEGEPTLVLGSGGIFGIGQKEVPVPMSRVTVDGEFLIVDSMTESDIRAANDFEFDRSTALADDRQLDMSGS